MRGIEIRKINPQEADLSKDLAELYSTVDWQENPRETLSAEKALKNSFCCFGAFDGERLVGFFRALSDGMNDAYMLDLCVLPSHRNRGVAKALIREQVEYLRSQKIEWITCISVPEAKSLYAKLGASMRGFTAFRF